MQLAVVCGLPLLLAAESTASPTVDRHVYDEFGCCVSCGFFWCGSSGRCLEEYEPCERGRGDPMECQFDWGPVDSPTVSFDLSPLRKMHSDYFITDSFARTEINYTYAINICANAGVPQLTSHHPAPVAAGGGGNDDDSLSACTVTSGIAPGDVVDRPAPAFQYFRHQDGTGRCYRLGGSVSGADTEFSLIDELNPAAGVALQYQGGNTCKETFGDKEECAVEINGKTYCSRSIKINFLCHNTIVEIPTLEKLEEEEGCLYEVHFHSVFGCPVQCHRDDMGQVCSDRGACVFTRSTRPGAMGSSSRAGETSCRCNNGFRGGACEFVAAGEEDVASNTGTGTSVSSGSFKWALICTYFLLFAVGGRYIMLRRQGWLEIGFLKWWRGRLPASEAMAAHQHSGEALELMSHIECSDDDSDGSIADF